MPLGTFKRTGKIIAALTCVVVAVIVMMTGLSACVPSYPKETLAEAVKEVCKAEYDMDVEVTLVGSTIGIYYPMNGLLDAGLGISESAWDTISNLLLIASRVVLSTDADIKFYCVITQDEKLPELQVVIIKYVEDVKKGMYQHISRGESFKRTLFSINLTPQARKERSVEQVFDRLNLDDGTRRNVLDEFFRSAPTKLSDIGYWKGHFYLKDINMEEFLAAQIENRLKLDFRGDKKLMELFEYRSSESEFEKEDDARYFYVKFKIADVKEEAGEGVREMNVLKVQEILKVANEVVCGYRFKDFDYLIMDDQLENSRLKVKGVDVYDFDQSKAAVVDIVNAPGGYF
ncbi:MAG: hypothetical protein PHH49_04410 [Candidatus Omnitrophica bacterium]|nr:hypothetical protein [Candidatus Omnitrophota bacterium]MDD5488191.1 hypothetical protein [Candidatus Omnitrophota bacterium]